MPIGQNMGASPDGDRATRPTDQARAGLGDTASVPSAFTPGPWEVGYKAFDVMAAKGQMKVCDIRGWGYLTGGAALNLDADKAIAIQTANANLIAAAPDMFEALTELRAEVASWNTEAALKADAALAKACGVSA